MSSVTSTKPLARNKTTSASPSANSVSASRVLGALLFDPSERIEKIRKGIPGNSVRQLATRMGTSKEFLVTSLKLSRATINRKEREGSLLSSDESERVLGVEILIGMAQAMVEESGDPSGFDAPRWVASWLARRLPALGGNTPASYMDTFEGQKLVADLMLMGQSGAYA